MVVEQPPLSKNIKDNLLSAPLKQKMHFREAIEKYAANRWVYRRPVFDKYSELAKELLDRGDPIANITSADPGAPQEAAVWPGNHTKAQLPS